MNILLLYPEMPETFWSMSLLVKFMSKRSSYPPLGLLTVVNLLPVNWNKKLVDLNVDKLSVEELEWADIVFISAMNVQSEYAKKAIEFCKMHNKPVAAGGPLFTHEYEKFPEVDYFILNEAEITLPLFIKDLIDHEPKRIYTTPEFADITKSPVPEWDLVNLKHYAYAIVQYSRGCPYMCDFCDVTALFGRRPRTKTSVQIINELNTIMRHGNPEMILFADDNLIGNKRDLMNNLLPALIEWRNKYKNAPGFATQVTINLADDDELIQMMIEAGFRHIFVGIETTDVKNLEACKKTQNLRRNLTDNVKYLQSRGFIITGGFIVGFDNDTEEVFTNLISFIQESGIVMATVNVLKAPPGTDLHKKLSAENRLLEPFDFDENKTNIITKLDKFVLYNGYKKILDAIYNPQKVYERAALFLSNYGKHKSKNPIRRTVSVDDLRTVLNIIPFILSNNRERKYFFKLISKTLLYNRKNIIHAFLFGLLMFQYKRLHDKFLISYNEIMRERDEDRTYTQAS